MQISDLGLRVSSKSAPDGFALYYEPQARRDWDRASKTTAQAIQESHPRVDRPKRVYPLLILSLDTPPAWSGGQLWMSQMLDLEPYETAWSLWKHGFVHPDGYQPPTSNRWVVFRRF